MSRITHDTEHREPLNDLAAKLGIHRKELLERFIRQGLDAFLTPGKCCLECSFKKCIVTHCTYGHKTRESGERAGVCAKCQECFEHTAKPKEEK